MKLAALCCFLMIVFSSFAISDSQIPPKITLDLRVIFFELWRDSGYGRRPDKIEESAWILKKPFGGYSSIRWPATWKKNLHYWTGPIPNGVVALAHTHTVAANPKPSKQDVVQAIRLQIPIYTISDKGIWVVDRGNVMKVSNGEWDKNVQASQAKSSPSLSFR